MKMLAGLFKKKSVDQADEGGADPQAATAEFEAATPSAAQTSVEAVNIWDLDEGGGDAQSNDEFVLGKLLTKETNSAPAGMPTGQRVRRNRTRLMGFDKSDGQIVDLFEDAEKTQPTARAMFPVGWLLVVDGPGRGNCFSLVAGMSQIGRGEDQTISLDFGDLAISRNNHAAVVFDANSRKFIIGHGGKANIVRLNGQPVISNEDLADGDLIRIGETTLKLKVLVGDDFDWSETSEDEEREDVAIA